MLRRPLDRRELGHGGERRLEPGLIQTEFGDVLMDPMLKRSGEGAYGALAKTMAQATKASYEGGDGSPPTVIADVVSSAIKANKPQTRYAAGKFAKLLLFMRKWLGDRMFDRVIMSMVK